jgi:hypothetical protein
MSLTETNFSTGAAVQPLPISPLQLDGRVVRDVRIKSLTVDCSTGEHEQLKIELIMPILNAYTLVNKPLYIRYGVGPNFGYFYGYTSNVSKPQSVGTDSQITITALGFSSIMKLSTSRMFQSMSTEQILREVLKGSEKYPYRIGLAPQDHKFVHRRLAQVGESDWEFAVRVAGMAGFYIYPYSGAIVMSQPMRALENGASNFLLEKSSQTLDNKPLLEFLPNERSAHTKADFDPEFTYFTPNGGTHTVEPEAPPQRRTKPSDYIYSSEYADLIIEGTNVMTGMYQTADARIRGNARVRVGSVVEVRTGVTPGATDSFDGIWYVNYVSHFIDSKVFQTALKLCRDKYRKPTAQRYVSFYARNDRNFPTMNLYQGGWRSSWSN